MINFDDNELEKYGSDRASFIISSDHGAFIAVVGITIFDTIILMAKLQATWKGLNYAIYALQAL